MKHSFSLHKDTTPSQPNHTVTPTHIKPEQYNTWNKSTISRKLLKMDVLTLETRWAVNREIIKQVTSSWSIFIRLCSYLGCCHYRCLTELGKSAKYSVTIDNNATESKSQMLLFESIFWKRKSLLEENWEGSHTTSIDTLQLLPVLSNIEYTLDKVFFFLALCDKVLPRLPDFKVNSCNSIYRDQRTQTRLSNWIPLKAIQSGQWAAGQYNGFPDWLACAQD